MAQKEGAGMAQKEGEGMVRQAFRIGSTLACHSLKKRSAARSSTLFERDIT